MPEIVRPEFVPDASASRAEMESLQREIAGAATFSNDHGVAISALANPLAASAGGEEPPIVAGVDQSFLRNSAGDQDRALSAVVAMRAGEVVERVHAVTPLEIPYIPGLLAFREGRPILEAVRELSVEPDLYCFDGSGRIHFRQAGIATHAGVVLDAPSVGVAKSLLCGEPAGDLENRPTGTRVPIETDARVDAPEGTLLGYAVQTKQYDSSNRYVNPLYVSSGHRVSAETAADAVLELAAGYKLPEPIRLADAYAEEAKADAGET